MFQSWFGENAKVCRWLCVLLRRMRCWPPPFALHLHNDKRNHASKQPTLPLSNLLLWRMISVASEHVLRNVVSYLPFKDWIGEIQ